MNTPTFALPDAIAVSLDIVSKESLAEKIISVESMGVLLGVLAGAIVTFGTQCLLNWLHTRARKRALSAAFFGEIYALLSLAEKREYLETYFREYLILEAAEEYPVFDAYLQMQFDTYFTVYKSNVGEIGSLDYDIIPLVTSFYLKIFSIMEDMTKHPKAAWEAACQQCKTAQEAQSAYRKQLKDTLAQDIAFFIEIIDNGKRICEILSVRYEFKYIPVFLHVKSYNEFMNEIPLNCFIPMYQKEYGKDYLSKYKDLEKLYYAECMGSTSSRVK